LLQLEPKLTAPLLRQRRNLCSKLNDSADRHAT
jgi:hypothetical protein